MIKTTTIKDFENRIWRVTATLPTKYDFYLYRGFPNNTVGHALGVYIPTQELVAHLRSVYRHQKADLPVSAGALLKLHRQFSPAQIIEDCEGKSWEVISQSPTKHGFFLYRGRPRAPIKQGSGRYILTKELAAYFQSLKTSQETDLPISCGTLAQLRAQLRDRYSPLKEVLDHENRVWLVQREKETHFGFTIFFGVPKIPIKGINGVKRIILTKDFVDFLENDIKEVPKPDYPLPEVTMRRLIKRVENATLREAVSDVFGKRCQVRSRLPTQHGFDLIRGCVEGKKGLAIVLTRELAAYLKAHKLSETSLPLSEVSLGKFRKQLGIRERFPN